MADNSNSYTYKRYLKNKSTLNKAKIVILIGTIVLGIYFFITMQNKAITGISLAIIILIFYIALKYFQKWDKELDQEKGKNYHTWGQGAGAELSVLTALETLPPEYKTIPDFNTKHGNIDFIIIGPKGIFTIEVKASKGIISLQNNQVLINGKAPEEDYIKQTIAEKVWLINALSQKFQKQYLVTSLLEFTKGNIDKASIHGPIHGVWIGGYKFHNYLIDKSINSLTPEEINTIYTFLLNENIANVQSER